MTDLMMPVMGGDALIRTLRAKEPELKILAMSGLTEGEQTKGLVVLGVPELLMKPFDGPALLAAVHRLLHRA